MGEPVVAPPGARGFAGQIDGKIRRKILGTESKKERKRKSGGGVGGGGS